MNSFSPPSPRICGGSQRWSPDHRHIRLSAWCRAHVKASASSAKEPTSNGAAQSPNRQQATSATKSALLRHAAMSALWSLLGDKRTLGGHRQTVENDPELTSAVTSALRGNPETGLGKSDIAFKQFETTRRVA